MCRIYNKFSFFIQFFKRCLDIKINIKIDVKINIDFCLDLDRSIFTCFNYWQIKNKQSLFILIIATWIVMIYTQKMLIKDQLVLMKTNEISKDRSLKFLNYQSCPLKFPLYLITRERICSTYVFTSHPEIPAESDVQITSLSILLH